MKLSSAKNIPERGKKLAEDYKLARWERFSDQDAVAFLAQFLSTILHRRQKMSLDEIQNLLKSSEKFDKVWEQVLSAIESNGRKLLDITVEGENVVLDVHYPSEESYSKFDSLVEALKIKKMGQTRGTGSKLIDSRCTKGAEGINTDSSDDDSGQNLFGLDTITGEILNVPIDDVKLDKQKERRKENIVKETVKQDVHFMTPGDPK